MALAYKNEICQFIKNREEQKLIDILSKKEPKKADDDEKQAVNIQLAYHLSKSAEVSKDDIRAIMELENSEKTSQLDFVSNQFQSLVALSPQLENISKVRKKYENKAEEIRGEHQPAVWLDTYAGYACGVKFATHVAKLTHSSISNASSFYIHHNPSFEQGLLYLTTESLANPDVDVAIDDAKYTPVDKLLKLEIEGKSIASYLAEQDATPFKYLAKSQQQLENWITQFSSVWKTDRLASHALAKQIYFPISDCLLRYHLLCNVKSSSLAQIIHLRLRAFDKKQYKLKEKKKFSKDYFTQYPHKAKLALTSRDAAKNVSPLNSERAGKITLLSALPPIWQPQLKAPIQNKSLFDESSIYWQSKTDIDYLRDFLLRFEQIELSIKHPKRKKWIEDWIDNIIDEVFYYVSSIHQIPAGWSSEVNIRLKIEYQYLLDPYRSDEPFQLARQASDWHFVICGDFAKWLNRRLVGKDKQFTPQEMHTRMWHKLFENALREFNNTIDPDRKDLMEVVA